MLAAETDSSVTHICNRLALVMLVAETDISVPDFGKRLPCIEDAEKYVKE
jgi:hypothetical protein